MSSHFTVIQSLVRYAQAQERCRESRDRTSDPDQQEHWRQMVGQHQDEIDHIVRNYLPSGSGIDSGTSVDTITEKRVVLTFGFHHMNEDGMYDGWTHHSAVITPSFDGIDIRITGPNRNQIKDHLYETFHYALTQPYEPKGFGEI